MSAMATSYFWSFVRGSHLWPGVSVHKRPLIQKAFPCHDVFMTLRWRHNDRDSVSNHQPHDCLLNRLFRRRSKKTSKLRVTGLCAGIHRGPVNSPHKWPVTRKMFPFDDVIMIAFQGWVGPFTSGAHTRNVLVTDMTVVGTYVSQVSINPALEELSILLGERGLYTCPQYYLLYHGHWRAFQEPVPRLNIKTVFLGMGIPMLKIRLLFTWGSLYW